MMVSLSDGVDGLDKTLREQNGDSLKQMFLCFKLCVECFLLTLVKNHKL